MGLVWGGGVTGEAGVSVSRHCQHANDAPEGLEERRERGGGGVREPPDYGAYHIQRGLVAAVAFTV